MAPCSPGTSATASVTRCRRSRSRSCQAGVAAVLSILRSSAVVVDEADHVLKASAPAYAFGLVRGNTVLSTELLDVVAQVRRDGQIRESELDLPAPTAAAPAR